MPFRARRCRLHRILFPRSWRSRYAPLSGTGPERYIADLGSGSSIISVNRNFGLTKLNGYEPTLAAATKNLGDRVEIRIRDNGGGIPAEVMDKIFNPFFTTKPPGEGTGLGLSLSHDIVVKQHAGSIEVDTRLEVSSPSSRSFFRAWQPRAKQGQTNELAYSCC